VFAGEALVDIVMRVPALPARGGDLLATSAEVTVGGGFNVMAAAARQGLPVLYAGGHGTGPWGEMVRAALAAEGIGVLRPPDTGRDTGFDVALVEPDGERTFVTRLGAEMVPGARSWDTVPVHPGDAVYVSGYGLTAPETGPALSAWAAALPPGVLLFVDPSPLAAQIPAPVLDPVRARCDWLSSNEREAALLANVELTGAVLTGTGPDSSGLRGTGLGASSQPSPAEAARLVLARGLLDRTGRADVIVRVGAAGCYIAQRGSRKPAHVPAPAVVAVDTTGAGDAHSGVFLAALAEGLPPLAAAARANAAAAFAVTRQGPATSPTRGELDAWLSAAPLSSHP
jgi:sugar/nucleoside kinase (ribokinase family)